MSKSMCRSPECGCEIEKGQTFCSPYCESDVGKSLPSQPCQCGHDACRSAASKESNGRRGTEQEPVVVVTGVSGLIGTALVEDLSRDYRMVGLDIKKPQEESAEGLDFIECDLTSDSSTSQAFDELRKRHGTHLASVIHLAAYYDFAGEPSPLYQKLTVNGTSRVLRYLQSFEVEQFVFSSSLLVMKPVESGQEITELSPTEALWDYPQSKREAERVILAERGAIPTVILRIAGVYDEGCHSIPIANQIQRIYEKQVESHFFPGDRSHGQPFVHREDLVRCFRRTVERRDRLSDAEVFLIGEPEVVSYGELQDELGEMLHGKR
ncbi:MAG TPA: NAD(P)-dependent oxidoreductase, partial [Vicinamibacteria bacterium]|nr:NAD(P)-dependent oxidoreductase [Vicinamibacteria bacterium]